MSCGTELFTFTVPSSFVDLKQIQIYCMSAWGDNISHTASAALRQTSCASLLP